MKNTLVLVCSNRNVEKATTVALAALVSRGAARLDLDHVGDVALARNLGLSRALEVLHRAPRYDVVLMVDDDMVFTADQAQELVAYVRATGVAASAAYVLHDGMLAASHYRGDRWQTGLGFLAIPFRVLDALAHSSRKFRASRVAKEWTFEFTESSPVESETVGELVWEPEDYCLTRRLGGVVLLPLPVGHIKRKVLTCARSGLADLIAAAVKGAALD